MQTRPTPTRPDRRPPIATRRCSFCGKWELEVEHMITSKNSVHICNECVVLCSEIIAMHRAEDTNA
jgi:hypothetical protein